MYTRLTFFSLVIWPVDLVTSALLSKEVVCISVTDEGDTELPMSSLSLIFVPTA